MDMVNDAETTRKKLTLKLENETKMLSSLGNKKKYLRVLTILAIVGHVAFYYISGTIVI